MATTRNSQVAPSLQNSELQTHDRPSLSPHRKPTKINSGFLKPSPLLKWAGGKTQLLPEIITHYPKIVTDKHLETYIEPFIGGGSVYFNLVSEFAFKRSYLCDTNHELIILYNTVKENCEAVIKVLKKIEEVYMSSSPSAQQRMFYEIRDKYNNELVDIIKETKKNWVIPKRAAQTLFLNRTCFNGLFRVNSKGYFNVPHGSYKNPTILFEDKIKIAALYLKNATILQSDFSNIIDFITENTFVYYDPPYRPVSKTSNFNSYNKNSFDDNEQKRLADLFFALDNLGVHQMLSNSDPCNYTKDLFFDNLYSEFNIHRVHAKRSINSKASARGRITELLITNY